MVPVPWELQVGMRLRIGRAYPGYSAVQLLHTSDRLGFVQALFKQQEQFLIITLTGNAYHKISIFKSFCCYLVILSLYTYFLFDCSFWHAFCNP